MAEEVMSTQGQRNQTQGQRRRLKPRSKVWEHFTRDKGDDVKEKARCNRCGKVYVYYGTKNLWEHLNEGCGGQQSADAGTSEQPPQPLLSLAQDDEAMQQLPPLLPVPLPPPASACAPSLQGGSSDRGSSALQEEACKDLARMIALDGYDAAFLESHYFRSFVRRFNSEFEVPSRVVVENMCDGIFDEARRDLLDRLRRAPGKVSVAVGRAKTMEEDVFYVACHFIDDGWSLHKLLSRAIVTTDHHDNHDGAILGLDTWVDDIGEIYMRVWQVTDHEINGEMLFMVADYNYDPGLKQYRYHEPDRFFTTYVDNVLHSIARCLLPHQDFTREVSNQICSLNLTRQGRLKLIAELDLHYACAYDEHWYACYCSLEVMCKKGFLADEDLVIAKLLCKIWEKIYRAIQKISSSTGPTANLCLAELFKLRTILQLELSSADHGDDYNVLFADDKDVTCVLREACDTLDEAIQDSYLAWSLPLALDPRYKLEFISFNFKRVYGSEAAKEYVSKVTTMITDLYADYVKEYGTIDGTHHSDSASAMDTTTSEDDPLEQEWNEHCRSLQGMATKVSSCYHPEAETELDRYLKDDLIPQAKGFDILNWWKAHSSEYPMVARMARDALAMPASSKLSSDQMAHLRSILRGYSDKPHGYTYGL